MILAEPHGKRSVVVKRMIDTCVSGAFQARWSVRCGAWPCRTFFRSILWWTKSVASNLRSVCPCSAKEQQWSVRLVAIFEVSGPSHPGNNDFNFNSCLVKSFANISNRLPRNLKGTRYPGTQVPGLVNQNPVVWYNFLSGGRQLTVSRTESQSWACPEASVIYTLKFKPCSDEYSKKFVDFSGGGVDCAVRRPRRTCTRRCHEEA